MTGNNYKVERYAGQEINQIIDELASAFVRVYRDFPYLFAGDESYEHDYLQSYIDEPRSLIIIVRYHNRIVGASTCIPLESEDPQFVQPIRDSGIDPGEVLYLGDSVLDAEHRGQGLGVEFFTLRESHGLELGRASCLFCSVQRPSDHPLRPNNYVPLDSFWEKRGYWPTGITTSFVWQDLNESQPTSKELEFWRKDLV